MMRRGKILSSRAVGILLAIGWFAALAAFVWLVAGAGP